VTPPGKLQAESGVAVPAEKTWGKGKDEDERKVFRAAVKDGPVSNIDPGGKKQTETRSQIFVGISIRYKGGSVKAYPSVARTSVSLNSVKYDLSCR
jgi:hypothetical protein